IFCVIDIFFFFFSSRRRHTRCYRDWSSDVCSSDLVSLASVNSFRDIPKHPFLAPTLVPNTVSVRSIPRHTPNRVQRLLPGGCNPGVIACGLKSNAGGEHSHGSRVMHPNKFPPKSPSHQVSQF